MYKALKNSLPQERIKGRRYNFGFRQRSMATGNNAGISRSRSSCTSQRQVSGTFQSHRSIELLLQKSIHRHSRTRFHQLLQQDEADTTIPIAPVAQRSFYNLLSVCLLEGAIQPQAIRNLQCMLCRAYFGCQPLLELELRVCPSTYTDLCRMCGIGFCLEKSSFITFLIDSFQIEQQRGRQSGLMQQ